MRKYVQFTFLNLLCREHKVTKLRDLFLYWLPNYNFPVLHCIEYSDKNSSKPNKKLCVSLRLYLRIAAVIQHAKILCVKGS